MLAYFFMISKQKCHVHRFRGDFFFNLTKLCYHSTVKKTKTNISTSPSFFIHKLKNQGSSNLEMEGKCAADFSFNLDRAQPTCGFLKILKKLISMLGCV